MSTRPFGGVILANFAPTSTPDLYRRNFWHDERAIRDKFRIHYANLDPAVGSTGLFAVAWNRGSASPKPLVLMIVAGIPGCTKKPPTASARRC